MLTGNAASTMSLHLRFETKYSLKLIANKKTLIFGDVAFDGNAIFMYSYKTKQLICQLWLRCNDKLTDYNEDQHIFIKAVMWTKNKTITSQVLGKDFIILPKKDNVISWKIECNVKSVLKMITFYIKMATPAKPEMKPFVPTFKEIKHEVNKLSIKEIKTARDAFNNWLDKGCLYLVNESLEQEIANKLIKKKQKIAQQFNSSNAI